MKIEGTPKEIAELVTELQTRLMEFNCTVKMDDEDLEELKQKASNPTVYVCDRTKNIECQHKNMCSICDKTTLDKRYARLDKCGNPLTVHHSAFQDIHILSK